MWQMAIENVAAPVARRLGTTIAAFAAGIGESTDVVSAVEVTVVWAVLLGVDLLFSASNRAKLKEQVRKGLR